jgi:serine protease
VFSAWEVVRGGSPEIVVSILDDGVDLDHEDLQDNLPLVQGAVAMVCGRNFVDSDREWDPRPMVFESPFTDPCANDIHGTACAGIVAARGDNKIGVAGVAWQSRILPVKIFAGGEIARLFNVSEAIRYAARESQILLCAWNAVADDLLTHAIGAASLERQERGCVVVSPAGNGGLPEVWFPANHPDSIAVGGCSPFRERSTYANYGERLDVVAPGGEPGPDGGIWTTDYNLKDCGFDPENLYAMVHGTSFAAAITAGVVALMLTANPNLGAREIRSILRRTAAKIDEENGAYYLGKSPLYGYGRLDAGAAVREATR